MPFVPCPEQCGEALPFGLLGLNLQALTVKPQVTSNPQCPRLQKGSGDRCETRVRGLESTGQVTSSSTSQGHAFANAVISIAALGHVGQTWLLCCVTRQDLGHAMASTLPSPHPRGVR